MAIAGYATREGSERYRNRMAADCAEGHFRRAEELWWSSIGVGTYLGAADDATDELVAEAIVKSVESGINVVDTAINYRRQRAERSVGAALRRLLDGGKVRRDEIVLCTKGGFLPRADGPEWFRRVYGGGQRGGAAMKDLVADCHCMHPAYLADQLEQSRANLGVETVDVYYVHNPETQLGHVDQDVFYARLEAAFRMLEQAAKDGKIRYYGLATWSAFRTGRSDPRSVSLERAKAAARKAAGRGEDRFRFVQLPFNLKMPEAMAEPTQCVGKSVKAAIPAALELGIHSVSSASIAQGDAPKLARDMGERLGAGLASDAHRALQFARSAPGIVSALVGMKRPEHVAENLGLRRVPPLSRADHETFLKRL